MSKDRKIGIGAAAAGLAVVIYSFFINVRVALREPGPRLFPRIGGIILILCGIGLIITSKSTDTPKNKVFLGGKKGIMNLFAAFLILVCYGVLLNFLGFVIPTPLFILAVSRLFSKKEYNWVTGIVVAVTMTAILYFVFTRGFNMQLPKGIF